jgi:hypothetical protein
MHLKSIVHNSICWLTKKHCALAVFEPGFSVPLADSVRLRHACPSVYLLTYTNFCLCLFYFFYRYFCFSENLLLGCSLHDSIVFYSIGLLPQTGLSKRCGTVVGSSDPPTTRGCACPRVFIPTYMTLNRLSKLTREKPLMYSSGSVFRNLY